MPWLKSYQELARHPQTKKFARRLGVSLPAAIGHLHLLWWFALDFAEDGDLSRFEFEDIADGALWEGDPTAFMEALVESNFIDREEDGRFVIHDWGKYTGRLLEKRTLNRERQRKWRQQYLANANVTRYCNTANTDITHCACVNDDAREDKKREEIDKRERREDIEEVSSKPALFTHLNCTEVETQILAELKAVPGYPFNFDQDLDYIRTLATEFPTVDLLTEAKKWRTYKRDKPLKPKSNARLQFRNWLEKAAQWQEKRAKSAGSSKFDFFNIDDFLYKPAED